MAVKVLIKFLERIHKWCDVKAVRFWWEKKVFNLIWSFPHFVSIRLLFEMLIRSWSGRNGINEKRLRQRIFVVYFVSYFYLFRNSLTFSWFIRDNCLSIMQWSASRSPLLFRASAESLSSKNDIISNGQPLVNSMMENKELILQLIFFERHLNWKRTSSKQQNSLVE